MNGFKYKRGRFEVSGTGGTVKTLAFMEMVFHYALKFSTLILLGGLLNKYPLEKQGSGQILTLQEHQALISKPK